MKVILIIGACSWFIVAILALIGPPVALWIQVGAFLLLGVDMIIKALIE